MPRSLLIGLAMLALAVIWRAAFAPEAAIDTAPAPVSEIVERKLPDLIGDAVTFTQFHPDGRLDYRLEAGAVEQFTDDQLTRLIEPQLGLHSPQRPPWEIQARHGYLRKSTNPQGVPEDVVFLREAVQLRQIHPRQGTMTVRSEAFYVYPQRELAQTDRDVMIDTSVGRTQAAGLSANLASGVMDMYSSAAQRVHTIILPEQFKQLPRATD